MVIRFLPNDFITWSKKNSTDFSIILMRTMMGFLWLSEGLSKILKRDNNMYEDYNGFLGQLNWAASTHPFHWFSKIISDFMIPNFELLVLVVIIMELSIATSLLLGLFTRFGSLLAVFMTINLWFLTLGWGEWVWTYPLIFIPHVVLLFSHTGKELGIDRYFAQKDNKFLNLIM